MSLTLIKASGLDAVLQKVRDQQGRMRNLKPMFKEYGRWLEKHVDDCFHNSVDWNGTAFPPLSPATIEARINKLASTKTLTKSSKANIAEVTRELRLAGKSEKQIRAIINFSGLRQRTFGATSKRAKMMAPGGIKILVDTARARNSQHTDPQKHSALWSMVGYMKSHIGGTGRAPVRNPSPFIRSGGQWVLHPKAVKKLAEMVRAHVIEGKMRGGVE